MRGFAVARNGDADLVRYLRGHLVECQRGDQVDDPVGYLGRNGDKIGISQGRRIVPPLAEDEGSWAWRGGRSFHKERIGWLFTRVSSFGTDFNYDFQATATPEELAKRQMFYNFKMANIEGEEQPGGSVF